MIAPPSASQLRRLRYGLWILALAGLGYLYLRFDNLVLPGGCSPLVRFSPGNRLLVDRQFRSLEPGDAVLFQDPAGPLLLGRVDRSEPGRYWIVTDAPDCPGRASEQLGWIDQEQVAARIVFAWPF